MPELARPPQPVNEAFVEHLDSITKDFPEFIDCKCEAINSLGFPAARVSLRCDLMTNQRKRVLETLMFTTQISNDAKAYRTSDGRPPVESSLGWKSSKDNTSVTFYNTFTWISLPPEN